MTVIGSGLSSYGGKCGDLAEECTPLVINRILGDYDDPLEVFRQLGIESGDRIRWSEVQERLSKGEIVFGYSNVLDGTKDVFLVKEVGNNTIRAINQFGEDREYSPNQVESLFETIKLVNKSIMNFLF